MTLKYLSDEHITVKFSLSKSLHLWIPLLLSFYGAYKFTPTADLIFLNTVIIYFTVCLGHCVGLHRHIIHESFKAPHFMKFFFLLLSSFSGIGGPLTWIKVHALRDYWQNQERSPRALTYDNSIFHDFFINLHCRIYPTKDVHLKRLPKALIFDKSIKFFETTWIALNLLFFFILIYFFSLEVAIWLVAIRISVSIVGHWLVGYIVHKWGYESYKIEDAKEQGKNSLVLGWLTFGEAYHNNHHKFPDSASMGLRKYEFDLAYTSILILKKIGLASDIKLPKEHYKNVVN